MFIRLEKDKDYMQNKCLNNKNNNLLLPGQEDIQLMRDPSGSAYLAWLRNHTNPTKEEKTLSGKNLLESFPMLNAFNVRIR